MLTGLTGARSRVKRANPSIRMTTAHTHEVPATTVTQDTAILQAISGCVASGGISDIWCR